MKFSKYIGAGNDFLVFDNRDYKYEDLGRLTRKVCDRHFGLGADGSLFVEPASEGDIRMRYFNSDGSEGEMCGNGIRAFSKYIYDTGIVVKDKIIVETLAGLKEVRVISSIDGKVKTMEVDMGMGDFNPRKIPVDSDKEVILEEEIKVDGRVYNYSAVLLGVPHVVIFVEDISSIDIDKLGSKIELDPLFPKKINVNFVEVKERNSINIYTWERGAGRTLGCGTGSCSAVLIGNRLGLLEDSVQVKTEGGSLEISLKDSSVKMIGSADLIATGKLNI